MLLLSEYANRLSHIKSILDNRYIPEVKRQQDEAKKLLALIKKNIGCNGIMKKLVFRKIL